MLDPYPITYTYHTPRFISKEYPLVFLRKSLTHMFGIRFDKFSIQSMSSSFLYDQVLHHIVRRIRIHAHFVSGSGKYIICMISL